MKEVVVSGSFDTLLSSQVRFLEEAAQECRRGQESRAAQEPWLDQESRVGQEGAPGGGTGVHALLWSDALVQRLTGQAPRFPQAERRYVLEALRFVERVSLVDDLPTAEALPPGLEDCTWVVSEAEDSQAKRDHCASRGIGYRVLPASRIEGFPDWAVSDFTAAPGRKKALVTGCYDWLHSGHVRFFEEVSQLGDLYVIVGNDANVRLLKGEGHPMFGQEERRYLVGAVRFVKAALITTGMGWMDAEPEIARIKPDLYVVNEDGDKAEKRVFCAEHGLEYVVLKRLPKEGLLKRESTKLRGF